MFSAGTDSVATVDRVFIFVLGISVSLLVAITVVMIWFVIRYSRKKNPRPVNIESNMLLEITWITVPTLLVLAMFYYGWSGFVNMRTVPEDAMQVKATGKKWSWGFEYENGKKSSELNVPAGRPVKLLLTSEDVIHSLYIPAFRIKEDAVPGMETFLWFLPDEEGEYDLFCTEYCGVGHSSMVSKVIVMPEDDFSDWYAAKEIKGKEAAAGRKLLEEKGCLSCHTVDGSALVGPTFKGLYGKKVVVMHEGEQREVTADEEYIRESILEPDEDIVKGFPDIMPSQEGKITDQEIDEIIRYLKELK